MKVIKFDYTKKNSDKSERKVMILQEKDSYLDGIDYNYLSATEITRVEELKKKFEQDLKPFTEKAFRRFSISGMSNIEEDKSND